MAEGMRLRARDAEDLAVVSALLQDAIIPIGDLAFLPQEGLFILMASRFLWEGVPEDGGPSPDDGEERSYRILCAVRFHNVRGVRRRGLDLARRDQFLSLLSVEAAGDGVVLLHLSGGADIRLEGEAIECRLEDRGQPWPVTLRPDHGL
ncbi:DUF2948 family protein [Niveispirillum fermenti]|uniref:DUF2948 family protein n=1 Tax=Niveispirillum fermenti TaxID=1233113 RepID=UPI003A84AFE3